MGPYDYYAVARANQILAEAPELVADFDRLKPRDFSQYMRLQASWLMNDIYLLGIRLRRKPEQKEISEDLEGRKELLRYKIFYALRYPDRMEFP
jgi:hypothetical protein